MSTGAKRDIPFARLFAAWVIVLLAIGVALYPSANTYINDARVKQEHSSFKDQVASLWEDNQDSIRQDALNSDTYNDHILDYASSVDDWGLPDPWGGNTDDSATKRSNIQDGINTPDGSHHGSSTPTSTPGGNPKEEGKSSSSVKDLKGNNKGSQDNKSADGNSRGNVPRGTPKSNSGSQKGSGNQSPQFPGRGDYEKSFGLTEQMGHVIAPKAGINIPFFHAGTHDALFRGGEHIYGTSLPTGQPGTHTGIAAHSGIDGLSLFDNIEKLSTGDVFYIDTPQDTLAYRVEKVSVVRPHESSALKPQKGLSKATLVTCTPYGVNSHRLLVTGEKISLSEARSVAASGSTEVSSRTSQWDDIPQQETPMPASPDFPTVFAFSLGAISVMIIVTAIVAIRAPRKQE